jgi:flagellar basal-body rod protein FlgG
MRTTGYKQLRAEFQDLLYEDMRKVGSSSSQDGTIVPTGVQIGYGVKTAATSRIMTQGSLMQTGKQFDVAIRGEGFLRIAMPNGQTGYTRDGSLELDANGNLVTLDGYRVEPTITIPQNAKSVSISKQGVVEVTLDGQSQPQNVGQIQLARFVNKSGLAAVGDNLYLETKASGEAMVGAPDSDGFGSLMQHYLESSNVNAVSELSDLIAAQRAYEMNAKVISSSDEMMKTTSNILR